MTLHLPTLMLALLLGFALLTLELGVVHPRLRLRPEFRLWTRGCVAMLVGLLFLMARVVLPLEVSVLLGNGCVALALALFSQALFRLLRDEAAPRWLMSAQPLVWLGLVLMIDWPLHLRTSVVSALFVVLLWPGLRLLWGPGWHAERSLRTVAVTMALAALSLALRALHAVLVPTDYTDLMQPSLGQSLTFLSAFVALVGAGFGFVLAVCERITSQMEVLATHDGLTGCLNRATTDTLLSHALQGGRRSGRPVAFVLMDLDHFKHVNDAHGHRTGDDVLRRFADTVRQRLRGSDVFGRTGGEEFGLVLADTDAAGARVLVEAVRQAVEGLALTDGQGHSVQITVSAGVAVATPEMEISADRLYGRADQSLYEAKRGGRNRVVVYGDSNPLQAPLPLSGYQAE